MTTGSKKFACQTTDTVQEGTNVGSANRKSNVLKNSWSSSDDRQINTDDSIEEENMRHCNNNQEDIEDAEAKEKKKKYKYLSKN